MPDSDIVYLDDHEPGIGRRKARHGWGYWDVEGKRITDREEIDRLKSYVHPRPIDLTKDREARTAFRAGLHLPRATRYLNRYERGLIAFLEGESAPHAKAA